MTKNRDIATGDVQLTPQYFGAKANGGDDSAAFIDAFELANSQNELDLYIPPGDYVIEAQLPVLTAPIRF